jgi:glutamate synthase (NADPH/NADH) small chain
MELDVLIVGAGPAGLACAHRLAMLGHAVTLFDDKPKLGGLNEYGLATYKTVDGFAQKEVDWLLSIGGIEVKPNHCLGRDMHLDALVRDHDAVFLGLGLAGVNALGLGPEAEAGSRAAVDFIAELRQAESPAAVPVGRRVLVIGGGMTAVDAGVQSRLLGAEDVSIVYRRGPQAMSASSYEQQWAQRNGVRIRHWAAPKQLLLNEGRVSGMRFVRTRLDGAKLVETGESFELEADVVLRAIGQSFVPEPIGSAIALQDGRIATDAQGQTSHPKVWAGGDCRSGGRDLTVEAVEHGKVAAIAIDRQLRA